MTAPDTTAVARPRVPIVRLLAGFGPAFVAAIAYVDPGNVATNITAGATRVTLLVWVLVVANTMAAVVQYSSARLGLVSGASLPELLGRACRAAGARVLAPGGGRGRCDRRGRGDRRRRRAAAALRAAPAARGIIVGGGVTGPARVAAPPRQRLFEGIVSGSSRCSRSASLAGLFVGSTSWPDVAGGLVPRLQDGGHVLLAASMLGATVMPHAIYLHSRSPATGTATRATGCRTAEGHALGRRRRARARRRREIAMLVVAAAPTCRGSGHRHDRGCACRDQPPRSARRGVLFAVGLLASGLASKLGRRLRGRGGDGGLLKVRVPLLVRRS